MSSVAVYGCVCAHFLSFTFLAFGSCSMIPYRFDVHCIWYTCTERFIAHVCIVQTPKNSIESVSKVKRISSHVVTWHRLGNVTEYTFFQLLTLSLSLFLSNFSLCCAYSPPFSVCAILYIYFSLSRPHRI